MLSEIQIKSPCPANWDEMSGDERERYCGLCKLSVYNLSDMTTREAETFLRERTGTGERTCIKMYTRSDGKVMTDNCPRVLRRLRNAARAASARVAVAVKLLLVLGLGTAAPAWAQSRDESKDQPTKGQMLMGKPAGHILGEAPAYVLPKDNDLMHAMGGLAPMNPQVNMTVTGHLLGNTPPPPAVNTCVKLTDSERKRVTEAQALMLAAPKLIASGKLPKAERNYARAVALLAAIPGQTALHRYAVQQRVNTLRALNRNAEADKLNATLPLATLTR